MFNTSQPLGAATRAFCVVHYAPYLVNGHLQPSVLLRSQRVTVAQDGTLTPVGSYVDIAFTPAQLAAVRARNGQLDSALTALASAMDTLAPDLGL